MKKLRLELDELCVEAFETEETAKEHGTVEGHNLPCSHPNVCPASRNWWCTGVCTCTQYVEYCF